MSEAQQPVSLTILGKEYKIICAEGEQDTLTESAKQLDHQMRDIRLTGKVSSAERVAVLAALNLTHELMQVKQNHPPASPQMGAQLNKMCLKIETTLKSV
jgi:cell division protein ZapA